MLNKEAVKLSGTLIVALFLITSIFVAGTPISNADGGSRAPKTIWGYVTYCSGGAAVGASVVVHATGYPDETDTTGTLGEYQVDVGPDGGGTEWPTGTPFTVTATISGWSGTNTGTVAGSVTQVDVTMSPTAALVATANANPTTVVVGETVSFTGSATGGATPYTWDWNFGDGSPHSSLQNPTHSYSTTGSKTVVLTVTDTCSQTDTDTLTITVNPALSCDAGGPYTGTICTAVSFSGTASGGHPPYTYSWTFGDGGTGSGSNPTHQYTTDGSYTATLTVTDSNSDTASDTAPVTISTPAVVAEAGGPYSGTICAPISFSGSATGGCTPYTYSWTFGDGGTGSGQNPTHQYASDGSYTAELTVTDDKGASDTDTASVTISTTPLVADAHGPYNGYTNSPINFQGSASGGCTPYSYSWNFGDGGSSSQQNPSHTYTNSGTYTVTLTITDAKSQTDVDTTTATITISELDVDAGGPYYGDVDVPIQFYGSASKGTPPYYYQWSFGDGTISEEEDPQHTYSEPSPSSGYQVVLYVVDSKGVDGSDQTRAYVAGEDPTANAGGPYAGIVNEPVEFTGSAYGGTPPYTYSWDLDNDGEYDDATGTTAEWTWDTIGEYTISLKVIDDDDKEDTDDATVTITEANTAPNKPAKPTGQASGKPGTEYEYSSQTTDPENDQVEYLFDWGDDTDSGWLGLQDSGTQVTASHIWDEKGDYEIKVKARDEHGLESEWSDPLAISMPKNRGINIFFFNFLQQYPILYQLLQRFLKL